MLDLAKGHPENCDHPNFPSTSLVPTVGWTALLPEPCHQLPLGILPQGPLSPLQRQRRAGVAWRLMVLLPAVFLQGSRWAEQVSWACGWETPGAPWSLSLSSSPARGPGWPCHQHVMAMWDECCLWAQRPWLGHGASVTEAKINSVAWGFQLSRERGWNGSDSLCRTLHLLVHKLCSAGWCSLFSWDLGKSQSLLMTRFCWKKVFWLHNTKYSWSITSLVSLQLLMIVDL